MKKYRIELSEDQLRLMANCLEDISRFASGQCELWYTTQELLKGLPHSEERLRSDKLEDLFKEVKKTLFPKLSQGAFLTYNANAFVGNTYQMYRTMLYRLTVDNGVTNCYSSPALPSGNMGSIKVELIKDYE